MTQRKLMLLCGALAGALLAAACGTVEPDRSSMMDTSDRGIVTRGDNPNLPNPVTPQAANESAPQPQGALADPTNRTGMPGEPVGSTR